MQNVIEDFEFEKIARRTSVEFPVENFRLYSINVETEITLPIKYLKACLTFAENCRLLLYLHTDSDDGRPVILSVEETADFSAELLIGTAPSRIEDDSLARAKARVIERGW